MSIYVYRPQSSTSAKELAAALGGTRLRYFENGRFFRRMRSGRNVQVNVSRGDIVVAWGAAVAAGTRDLQARILNGVPLKNKFEDATRLRAAGVSTIEVARTRPAARAAVAAVDPAIALWEDAREAAEDFRGLTIGRTRPILDGITQFKDKLHLLHTALQRAVPTAVAVPQQDWVGRMYSHVGGDDLLNPPARPDFWVKKETFTEEFRVHSFNGKSIRAGKKVVREGFRNPNPWIRTWDGGWKIHYDGISSKKKHRIIAHAAVAALGLTFGAVDIGVRADGTLVVLEVNRAPGVEAGTITAYADAVRRWMTGA